MDIWPSSLPNSFLTSEFSHAQEDNILADGYDVGPPAYRRRTTSAPSPFMGTMIMTTAEWEAFRTFFHTTLADGTHRFLFPPQGTTDQARYWISRFIEPPTRSMSDADDLWFVSLSLEKLGSGESFIGPEDLFEDPDIFYTPTFLYDQTITVNARYSDPDTFYTPTIANLEQFITAGLFTDSDTFYAPTVEQLNIIVISFAEVEATT
jgi:hypothetical protein